MIGKHAFNVFTVLTFRISMLYVLPSSSVVGLRMSSLQLTARAPVIFQQSAGVSSSPVTCRRMGKRVREGPEWKRVKLSQGPWYKRDPVVMTAPLARTQHPVSAFSKIEDELSSAIALQSAKDAPDLEMDDPYAPAPSTCLLCPKRYAPGHAPAPHYLNPKLLSQFTSAHTGKVYERHITGLCAKMQAAVEVEILRAQAAGLMSTKVKNIEYLQDPQIVNPSKPYMPNPY